MPYLRNTWYVAAWAHDLAEAPLGLTLLEEPVVLLRDGDGAAHALAGRCPHRCAPLAKGRIVEGALECPYHGLRFSFDGRCVHNPHPGGEVPDAAVRAYPLAERHGLLWIWMGDPVRADEALIPDFGWLADPKWEHVNGSALVPGNYQLYVDNILDLSHASFVHPALRSNAWTRGEREFGRRGEVVWARYRHLDDYLSEGIDMVLGSAGRRMDNVVTVDWHAPSVLFLDFRAGEPGTPEEALTSLPSLHAFTPQDRTSTHYFWAVGRDFRLGDADFSAGARAAFLAAFELEDAPIIAAQQKLMGEGDFWDMGLIHLAGDAGGIGARRTLQRLIAAEETEAR
jgi:phenylpropionate dioxygenase-like ring-hydroxylating dioxygenase large terminal subunit